MNQVDFVSKLVDWFARQDRSLQSVVLGQIEPPDMIEMLDLIRKRIKSEQREVYPPGTKVHYVLVNDYEQQLIDNARADKEPDNLADAAVEVTKGALRSQGPQKKKSSQNKTA